jgi:acyl-coenzyme A thioesterase PaaI-like protein
MTHALFSLQVTAVTAALTIRYHHALQNEMEMEVEARRVQCRRHLHYMEATIHQNQRLCVSAEAKFMESNAH